jgi:hypothetical protein
MVVAMLADNNVINLVVWFLNESCDVGLLVTSREGVLQSTLTQLVTF